MPPSDPSLPPIALAFDKHANGALAEAEQLYRAIIETEPANPLALQGLGVVFRQTGRDPEALEFLRRATIADPLDAGAHDNLASVQAALGQHEEAVWSYDAAIRLSPVDSSLHQNRGKSLAQAGRHAEAVNAFTHAVELAPENTEAQLQRIVSELSLQRFSEALKNCTHILRAQPGFAAVLEARGRALAGLNRHPEACADFERSIAIDPAMTGARVGLAASLSALNLHREALNAVQQILAGNCSNATNLHSGAAWYLGGLAYDALSQTLEAAEAFEQSLQFIPNWGDPLIAVIRTHRLDVNWSKLASYETQALQLVAAGEAINPFAVLYSQNDPVLQRRCTESYMTRFYPPKTAMSRGSGYGHKRIRLAYASADFRDHPVGRLISSVIQVHDHTQFELIGVSYGPPDQSELRKKIISGFDRFLDSSGDSDEIIANWIREQEVDVLVDLTGYTREGRPGIFAHRPAPVQVNWLGTPGTLGAAYYDYVIADPILVSRELEASYSEKVIRLPYTNTPMDLTHSPAIDLKGRVDEGLPPAAFVFAAFNNVAKITPPVFDIWMRLLARCKGSVLWLRSDRPIAIGNIRREAEIRGIDPSRLVFARGTSFSKHIARHKLADLFLDTFPYGGCSTTVDAISGGLPVLSCIGGTYISRMSASILSCLGLSELIAQSLEEYEDQAINLATSPTALDRVRTKLSGDLSKVPPFDIRRFCRDLEELYCNIAPSAGAPL